MVLKPLKNISMAAESIGHKRTSKFFIHLRVPSKRVAIVSRKVFCGARSPFRAGIGAYRNRDLYLSSPKQKWRNSIEDKEWLCKNEMKDWKRKICQILNENGRRVVFEMILINLSKNSVMEFLYLFFLKKISEKNN
jgi:hypothetical protein